MNLIRPGHVFVGAVGLAFILGCSRPKGVTERDRKEAIYLVSEAQVAMTLREWSRAEGVLARAVQLDPQGDFWLSLGGVRMHLGNRSGARAAYESAFKAYEFEAAMHKQAAEPWLKQAYVLGLLGRRDDSRAVIEKAAKRFPNDAKVRALTDPKELEKLFSTPKFKELAL